MSVDSEQTCDVIVLGAGPAGENVAGRVASAGLKTIIVEHELIGGECSYWACIPSKTMLRPQAVLAAARRVPGAQHAVVGDVDARAVFDRRNEAVSNYNDASQVHWLEGENVEIVRGHGRLVGERRVVVASDDGDRVLTANKAVVVATGSSAITPDIEGLSSINAWTSREATSSKSVPRRLVVIGGGVVAVEMAQAWKSLGCEEVTMIVRGDRLLEREEPFAGDAVASALSDLGVDIRFSAEAASFARVGDAVEVTLKDRSVATTDEVLLALGRRPNTADIGVDSVGLDPARPIEVDDQLRATGVDGDWLYAVGDVNGRALLTHMGKYQARLCSDVIAGKSASAIADHRAVTAVVFTDPEVASVGVRLAQAKANGLNVRELRVELSSASGAYVNGDQTGVAQLVVDEDRRVVIGATFVGPDVAELLHAATVAIVGEVTIDKLWHAVPAFPTVSEVWLRLLEQYGL